MLPKLSKDRSNSAISYFLSCPLVQPACNLFYRLSFQSPFPTKTIEGDSIRSLSKTTYDNHSQSYLHICRRKLGYPGMICPIFPCYHFLLHVLGHRFKGYLLYHISSDGSERDQLPVPWFLLLHFLKDASNVCFFFQCQGLPSIMAIFHKL